MSTMQKLLRAGCVACVIVGACLAVSALLYAVSAPWPDRLAPLTAVSAAAGLLDMLMGSLGWRATTDASFAIKVLPLIVLALLAAAALVAVSAGERASRAPAIVNAAAAFAFAAAAQLVNGEARGR